MTDTNQMRQEIEFACKTFLGDMIRIPSFSGQEGDVILRIKSEMEKVGFDDIRVDAFGNIIGRIGNGPRLLVFDAHVDTVEIGNREQWDFDPFSGEENNGYILGRGATDQEGGMASMIYAAFLMKKYNLVPPEFTILMTGSVSEEDCDGLCWRYLIEKESIHPELVVITEPTECQIYIGQRGRMEITAELKGISAHGSAPERGQNAIIKMARIINGIEALATSFHTDDFLGQGSITISQIRSAAPSLCSVADLCEIYMDRRLTWGETPDMAIQEIEQLDASGQLHVGVPIYKTPTHTGLVYPVKKEFPAWKIPETNPAVMAAKSTGLHLWNQQPVVDRWTFSTNGVAIAGTHKIPCIGFGPGREEWAHAPNERVAVEELMKAALFYAHFPGHLAKITS